MSAWEKPRGSRSAASALPFRGRPLPDGIRGSRKLLRQLPERRARLILLAELAQGHPQLQQAVGRLGALVVVAVGLEEGLGGVLELAADIVGLAKPVLGIAGELVIGMITDYRHESAFGLAEAAPAQVIVRPFV